MPPEIIVGILSLVGIASTIMAGNNWNLVGSPKRYTHGNNSSAQMGSGQNQTAWAFVETETECTLQLRGYGYTSNTYTTASGQLIAIPVTGIFQ